MRGGLGAVPYKARRRVGARSSLGHHAQVCVVWEGRGRQVPVRISIARVFWAVRSSLYLRGVGGEQQASGGVEGFGLPAPALAHGHRRVVEELRLLGVLCWVWLR